MILQTKHAQYLEQRVRMWRAYLVFESYVHMDYHNDGEGALVW